MLNSVSSNPLFVDESYFGAKRIKGKRGRGAGSKTPVFGILERGGKVYTEIIPDCAKVSPDIHSDGWRGYNGLVDLGYKKHFRVQHGTDEFVNGKCHINGIESFWSFAKRRLQKFHGIPQPFIYISKNVSFGLITETKTYMLYY